MGEVFIYEDAKLDVIKVDENVWFKAKVIANILEYKNTRQAILDHVEPEDKTTLNDLKSWGVEKTGLKSRGHEKLPLKNGHMMYINESGLYIALL